MAVTTNTRKLAALLGASGAGIGTDGLMQSAGIDTDMATQAELDAIPVYDDDIIQTNIALLGFKAATADSLAKYNLQDQIIDEYVDATGVNTGDSTNELLVSGAYKASGTSTATGGTITYYGIYAVHTFLSSGTFTPPASLDVDYLVVGGGGAGSGVSTNPNAGGGGGAGAFRTAASFAVTAQAYTITVGAGGTCAMAAAGTDGGNSIFSTITALGGGRGATYDPGTAAGTGGSGGGGSGNQAAGASGTYGNAGGSVTPSNNTGGAGGGGASAAGGPTEWTGDAGPGGAGTANSYRTNSAVTYSGGGGGGGGSGTDNAGGRPGGAGGGGAGGNRSSSTSPRPGTAGSANTGGGGGGGGTYAGDVDSIGGAGGSGIVVIRHTSTSPDNLTLQSSDTTAEAAPTKADMVMLIEDAGSGVGTVNTHIKGWISRYETGGTKTWTQGTLVDEGDWGTDKRILAFHDLTLTGTSGTQMAYKITTHSASAVYDTKIHATSIGWR